jgi:DNA-binding HxlR family transcriptional regulator
VHIYGQYCPVARSAEVFAERWTPIIMRNILYGCRTFNEIAAGAPGLSRALLTRRLRELARAGIIEIRAKPHGRGSLYEPTEAGARSSPSSPHSASGVTSGSMSGRSIPTRAWPCGRGARCSCGGTYYPRGASWSASSSATRDRPERAWLLIEKGDAELCAFDPGFGDDAVVTIQDPLTFARWHPGPISWVRALRSGGVTISGPRELVRSLPTWNRRPEIGRQLRAARQQAG